MTRDDLKAYLKRGRETIKAGLLTWDKRRILPAVAMGAAVALGSLSNAVRPPEDITPSEWAQKYRYISPDSGSPLPGKWDNATTPLSGRAHGRAIAG